jgi:hypothetical protein
MKDVRYFWLISTKTEVLQQHFLKHLDIKRYENLFGSSRVLIWVQTDGQRDFNRRFASILRKRLERVMTSLTVLHGFPQI